MHLNSRVGCCCKTCSQRRFPLPAHTLFTIALWVGGEGDVISAGSASRCHAVTSLGSRERGRDSVLPSMSDTEKDVIVCRCFLGFDSMVTVDTSLAIRVRLLLISLSVPLDMHRPKARLMPYENSLNIFLLENNVVCLCRPLMSNVA